MHPRNAILLAAAAVFVISAWVPFGTTILYPLSLFTTWVHEMGHGLTALALGGRFDQLEIFRNGSGLASCGAAPGWREALVALGGLLAPPILGTAILATVHGPRRARVLLAGLALALAVSLAIFVRSTAGVIAMPVVALALGWAAWRISGAHRVIVAQALGVLLALDTLTRMVSYVFTAKVEIDGVVRRSDIADIADNLGGNYLLWGCAVTATALGMLALGVWWAWRRPEAD
jgi:hypothetical protein